MITFVFDGRVIHHEHCSVEGCSNGRCYSLNSKYCYPHTQFMDEALLASIENKELKDHCVVSGKCTAAKARSAGLLRTKAVG